MKSGSKKSLSEIQMRIKSDKHNIFMSSLILITRSRDREINHYWKAVGISRAKKGRKRIPFHYDNRIMGDRERNFL